MNIRRFVLVLVVIVAALATMMVLVGEAEETEAWSTYTYNADTGSYRSGYVYYTTTKTSSSYPYCSWGYYASEERAWFGFPLDNFNSEAYISSARFSIRVNWVSSTVAKSISVRLLYFNPTIADASTIYSGISGNGAHLTSLSITGTGTYSFDVTDYYDLSDIRDAVADGDEHLFLGFEAMSSGYRTMLYYYYTTMTLYYDASAPTPPTLSGLSRFTGSPSTTIRWSGGYDNPTAPHRGLASYAYQIGAFRHPSDTDPIFSTSWIYRTYTAYTMTNLQDGMLYYFKIRSRDATGFTSGWSYYVYTTIDTSPPTVPVVDTEPEYTTGTTNIVTWSPSIDATSGMYRYEIQWATRPDFIGASTTVRTSRSMTYTSLTSGTTYYYRVRSMDALSWTSPWSVAESTTMDDAPPTVPELMAEPTYTPGSINRWNWHPATDEGIGVASYRIQVSNDARFGVGTLVLDTTVTATSAVSSSLTDGTMYYARVMATDHFGQSSAWSMVKSSIQDASGPGVPGLLPPPMYSPDAPLELRWNGSTDAGIGVGWYKVMWSNHEDFSANVSERDHVLGHSLVIPPLEINNTWFYKVMSFDILGNMGPDEVVNTTVDGIAPAAPVIDPEPAYTEGTTNTIAWGPSSDDLSGVDHYVVRVYARAGGSGLVFTDTTTGLAMDIPSLTDGATYWYEVTAVDMVGNLNISALVMSTQDASPPTLPHARPMPMFTAGTTVSVEWSPSIDMGSGEVEYMMEWSYDPTFALVTGSTEWIVDTITMYEVMDLMDGTTYFFRVKARDALDLESMWGEPAATTMDASAPPVPVMESPDTYITGPMVHVMWGPVEDGSGMPVEYQVMAYDSNETGATPVATSPWMRDNAFAFADMATDADLYFSVAARDHLGWTSEPSDMVSTMIDGTGPSAGTVDDLPEFMAGSGVIVTWTVGEDAGIGGVIHRLVAYADEAMTIPVHVSEWTVATEGMVDGLADGATYWFVIESRDAFDNWGEVSEPASTTMDMSPPVLTVDKALFGGSDGAVSGTCEDATSGVALVEASGDGGDNWVEADLDDEEWSVPLGDLPTGVTMVIVRASDAVGNMLMDHILVEVDTSAPVITINLPTGGSDVSGAVIVLGSISDANLLSYIVEVQASGASIWTVVQPTQATTGVAGTLATWVTAGLSGGDYTLRVTANDVMGESSASTVDVVLKGAHLSIGPGDISFSDSHPLPGDKVTVLVTVRNDGDSPAEGVTVVVMDGDTELGRQTGVTVPAHGTLVVPMELKASGDHDITARATSDLYDTGSMSTGQPLQTIEEEATLENAGGILGLVALIVAILALVLAILFNKRGGSSEPEITPAASEEVIIDPLMEPVPQQEPPAGMTFEPQALPPPVPSEQVEVEQVNMERPGT